MTAHALSGVTCRRGHRAFSGFSFMVPKSWSSRSWVTGDGPRGSGLDGLRVPGAGTMWGETAAITIGLCERRRGYAILSAGRGPSLWPARAPHRRSLSRPPEPSRGGAGSLSRPLESPGRGAPLCVTHEQRFSSPVHRLCQPGRNETKPPHVPSHRSRRKTDIQGKKIRIFPRGAHPPPRRPGTGSPPVGARPVLRSRMELPRGSGSGARPTLVLGLPHGGCGSKERTARPPEAAFSLFAC